MTNTTPWLAHDARLRQAQRAEALGQRPFVLWFTGLSGAGKTSLAAELERVLLEQGYHTLLLDGDSLRRQLNQDLGFSDADRAENIRRAGEVAALMLEAGLIVLATFISPQASARAAVRQRFADGQFVEVFVDVPVDVCETRDPRGLYRQARAGVIAQFTGVSAPYEAPVNPDIRVCNHDQPLSAAVVQVLEWLGRRGYLARLQPQD